MNTGLEADKAAHEFTASVASAYRLSTSKVTVSEVNTDLLVLDRLLKQKQRLRKLWQETRDTACKTAVKWVTKAIRWMTCRRALEQWEAKIANTDVTPQAIWPISKSLMKSDGPKELIYFIQIMNTACKSEQASVYLESNSLNI
jgi:hypothetical protein